MLNTSTYFSSRYVNLSAWLLACVLAGLTLLVYVSTSQAFAGGSPLMPVDDAYIHFQYAKQLALGQPYIYNPGLPPSSGATSFLYPYILATGYLAGFQGLNLGLWALIVGAVALVFSGWAIFRLVRLFAPDAFAVLIMIAFMLSGSIAWHFMSGMETGLMICFTLWTLYAVVTRNLSIFTLVATLLALTRPEGSIMAVIAALLLGISGWRTRSESRWYLPALLLPLLAVGIQPLVNILITGTASAAGNQAKSLFGMIPAYLDVIIGRVLSNFGQLWIELLTGINRDGIWYAPPLLIFALIGGITLFRKKHYVLIAIILLWLVVIAGAISTLDTAFWHFKRYQMPLIALLYPLAGWGVALLLQKRETGLKMIGSVLVIFALWTGFNFLGYYAQNVQSITAQPLAMARWLEANTPEDAVIAVHDVGMMRYIGNRTTLDMVGLTTPGAADAWRNGPGAVGEFLTTYQPRPDYVAAYTTARGLNYLANTGVYGELLAGFTADYDPRYNVALGDHFQGIFQPTWAGVDEAASVLQPSTLQYLTGFELVDQVDVADLASEKTHHYRWQDVERFDGFATEFYQQNYIACSVADCTVTDGVRRINGEEIFTLNTQPRRDAILITRVQPLVAGSFEVYAAGMKIADRWLPYTPGQWLEIATLIPAEQITANQTEIRIVPHTPGGHYLPAMHWLYQGDYVSAAEADADIQFQDGAFGLTVESMLVEGQTLQLDLGWYTSGQAIGDAKIFVHVYADSDQPPVAQLPDTRPGLGTMPPGNWLAGAFSDHFVVDLSQLAPGTYQVAIGLYDPLTNERLQPLSTRYLVDEASQRVFTGEITVGE